MRTNKFLNAALALAVSGLIPVGVAMADTIVNDIDGSIDATLENINLTVGGPTGTVHYTVDPANGDGKNGCNLVSGKTLTVDVISSNTSVATVSPSSFTFGSCGDVKTLTVTAVGAGSASVTLSETSNTTAGTFDLAPASFSATVSVPAPLDTTAPEIDVDVTPAPNGSGWNNSDVTVVWTVNDPESSISSSSGCDPTVVSTETDGLILTCEATSDGGTASGSVTIKLDKTKPVITGTADPAANGNGWNNSSVDVEFSCADTGSTLTVNDVANDNETLTTEGAD